GSTGNMTTGGNAAVYATRTQTAVGYFNCPTRRPAILYPTPSYVVTGCNNYTQAGIQHPGTQGEGDYAVSAEELHDHPYTGGASPQDNPITYAKVDPPNAYYLGPGGWFAWAPAGAHESRGVIYW